MGKRGGVSVMRTRFGVMVACMMKEKKLVVGSLLKWCRQG